MNSSHANYYTVGLPGGNFHSASKYKLIKAPSGALESCYPHSLVATYITPWICNRFLPLTCSIVSLFLLLSHILLSQSVSLSISTSSFLLLVLSSFYVPHRLLPLYLSIISFHSFQFLAFHNILWSPSFLFTGSTSITRFVTSNTKKGTHITPGTKTPHSKALLVWVHTFLLFPLCITVYV